MDMQQSYDTIVDLNAWLMPFLVANKLLGAIASRVDSGMIRHMDLSTLELKCLAALWVLGPELDVSDFHWVSARLDYVQVQCSLLWLHENRNFISK